MAKKKEENPYVEASLRIDKNKFVDLLRKQIDKGNELLKVDVAKIPNNNLYGGFMHSPRMAKVEYDEKAEKDFIADFKRWHGYNIELYKTSFDAPNNTYRHEYEQQLFQIWGSDIIKEYKDDISRLINKMIGDIEKIDLIPCEISAPSKPENNVEKDLSKVFVVHGHDNYLKETAARTLSLLGLDPIILHEQEDYGKKIIEKFESNALNIGFAVILLTADDFGISKKEVSIANDKNEEPNFKSRARQNVIFEMGYFMGKLDRAHVFLLLEKDVEKPGDLDGVIYTAVDSEGMWKIKLAKRLKAVGYKVNVDAIL